MILITKIDEHLVTIEDRDGDLVLSSLMFYQIDLPSRKLGVIEEVQTLPAFRRQGRATLLIKEAIKLAKNLRLDCVELTVREDRPDIQLFYQSLGFIDRLNRAYRLEL